MRVKLSPESSGGGGGQAVNVAEPIGTQCQTAPPPAVAPRVATEPALPPAAVTVINGDRTEETIQLREQLTAKDAQIEELKRQVKDREITVCEYQDKLHALQNPTPVPITAPKAREFRLGRFV